MNGTQRTLFEEIGTLQTGINIDNWAIAHKVAEIKAIDSKAFETTINDAQAQGLIAFGFRQAKAYVSAHDFTTHSCKSWEHVNISNIKHLAPCCKASKTTYNMDFVSVVDVAYDVIKGMTASQCEAVHREYSKTMTATEFADAIIKFAGMTDAEIKAHFKKNTGSDNSIAALVSALKDIDNKIENGKYLEARLAVATLLEKYNR